MGDWKKTQCNMCGLSCGLEMEVKDNKIVNVRPDPDSPRTPNTYCCRKGRSSKYFQEHSERLNYPLKKVGDHFERISWEQAYREIAQKANAIIEEHGPKCFAYCGGALACGQADVAFGKKGTLAAIGSRWLYNPTGLEFAGNWWSHGKILGKQVFTEADEKNVEVMIFWGSNSYVSHNVGEARKLIRKLSQDPDKMVISVDPRLSETARMADLHIEVRPGSDALLMRGLISLILDKGWQDQAYMNRWVADYKKAEHWFKGFDYREAFRVCHVPYEQMEKFARILTSKTWGVHQDLGLFCGRHNTMNSYLLVLLMAVTGNLLIKGNVVQDSFAEKGLTQNEDDLATWRTPETNSFPVTDAYPTGVMAKEILSEHPDHLRVIFASMADPARSWPDSQMHKKAFEKLNLFVVVDICMTETASYADYVLPGKTGFEAPDFTTFQAGFPEFTCMLRQPIIAQIGERKENNQIWLDILKEMGRVPKLPQEIFDAAKKAAETGDRIQYFMKLFKYVKKHKEQAPLMALMICDTLGAAYGSVNKAMLWAALITSQLSGTGVVERAGFKAPRKHKLLQMLNEKIKNICVMDSVFQAVIDTPQGVVCGISNPNREEYTKEHIWHEDGKIHFYCYQIDDYIGRITPKQEERALTENREFPMILSAGNHADGGDNGVMRNPATYVYRRPYVLTMNPEDAAEQGFSEGQEVRITTKTGSVTAPVEFSYRAARGYALIPHQFGLKFGETTYGSTINVLTSAEDLDEITGNPYFRYVPCRVEAV